MATVLSVSTQTPEPESGCSLRAPVNVPVLLGSHTPRRDHQPWQVAQPGFCDALSSLLGPLTI